MSASNDASSTATCAADPFNSRDAKVILRTSDDVDFRVHKDIVALASPVLAQLIALAPRMPPPASSSSNSSRRRSRRLVSIPQTSAAVDLFLRFIYPIAEPEVTLDSIGALLEVAKYFAAASVMHRMRTHLLLPTHLEADPTSVYALASFAGLTDVARAAARHTLAHPIQLEIAQVKLLPADALVRLLQYRKDCIHAAVAVARADDAVPWWVQLQWRRFCFLSECSNAQCVPRRRVAWHKTLHEIADVAVYWIEYMKCVQKAVRQKLDPRVARDPVLLRPAMEAGMKCARCAERVQWDMEEFTQLLEEAIEEAINSVQLRVSPGEFDEDADHTGTATLAKDRYLLPGDRPWSPLYDHIFPGWRMSKMIQQSLIDEAETAGNPVPPDEIIPDDAHSWAPPSSITIGRSMTNGSDDQLPQQSENLGG
ncbi:hypothetical protein BD413DRAFT_493977 [Trametes elegans]|nr:hypothetical protein BD413DRAFT_493977 [Trametes elegans]